MNKAQAASQRRLRLRGLLDEMGRWTSVVQGRDPLLAGSLYERRRRCGKARCRCASGRLHGSLALSVSRQGRSRLIPLAGLDPSQLSRHSAADRHVRQARKKLQSLCHSLLQEAERLRRVNPEQLRQVLPA
jgi:hypothetical protein